jgi:lactose/L-arabinose transport system substrate-binding protein
MVQLNGIKEKIMSHISLIKKLAFVFTAVMMILTACSPAAAPPQAEPQTIEVTKIVAGTPVVQQVVVTATAQPAATAKPKPTGKLTLWIWKAADDALKAGVMDDFKKEYPGIEIETVEASANDIQQKMLMAISAGTGVPDIVAIESSHLAQFVDQGGLSDISDLVAPYVDKMNAYKWPDTMKDGKYYAMPWDSGPVVLYYRRDVFKAAGLPDDPDGVSKTIATWDDYLSACKTIKEKTKADCFSLNKANNYARLYEMMLWQQGLGYVNDQGLVTVDSPENIATLEKMAEFWKANVVSDQLEWGDGWYAELGSKDQPIATLVEAAWMGAFLKGWIATGTAGNWGVALMPAMKAGQVRAANDGGSNLAIPEMSQNKEAARAFVEFALGRPQSQLKMFAASDFLPSLETTYDDALFIETDSFFGGQATRKVYVDVVKQIPRAYVYGPYYTQMNGFVSTAVQKVGTGAVSAADALKEAAEAIRQQTGLE